MDRSPASSLRGEELPELDRIYLKNRNAKLRSQAFLAERRPKEKAGELISRQLVARQAQYILIRLRQAILNFPTRYARHGVRIADEHQAKAMLTKAAHEFLTELATFQRRSEIRTGCRRLKPMVKGASSPIKRLGDQSRAAEGEDSSPEEQRRCEDFAPKAEDVGIYPSRCNILARSNLRNLFLAQQGTTLRRLLQHLLVCTANRRMMSGFHEEKSLDPFRRVRETSPSRERTVPAVHAPIIKR
jgi:hypothetical protein